QKKVFEAFAPMASLVNAPPMDLLQLSETLKASDFFERADGGQILFPFLKELRQMQPDGLAFTPKTVWNVVFHEDPPPDVTPENLAPKLVEAVRQSFDQRMKDMGIKDSAAWPNLLTAGAYGVKYATALELLVTTDKSTASLGFADIFPISGSAPAPKNAPTSEDTGIQMLAMDLHRMEYGADSQSAHMHAVMTVGNGPPLDLHPGSLTDPTQRENYGAAKLDNPIIQGVISRVRDLCGTGEGTASQRASVFALMSQVGTGQLRYMSGLVGAVLTEHSACDMRLDRLDNGDVRLRLETVAGSNGHGVIEFTISPDGNYRQTDFLLANRRPQQG
ncbi:MAG: hypothetical protein LBU23_05050, partial [Planctomycetota bacterium]|nr:hypothetical protein [Planctomycetota bacterium]